MKWLVISFAALTMLVSGCRSSNDDSITAEVRRELAEARVPGAIDIATARGVVTLTGTVPDTLTKIHAQDIADDVKGVDHVVNNLRALSAADAPLPGAPNAAPPPVNVPVAPMMD